MAKNDNPLIAANQQEIEKKIHELLELLGEDPKREGLLQTPNRVARAYQELLRGYSKTPDSVLNNALYELEDSSSEMIIVEDIPYDSMCEHHMLPFSGKAYIAYIPDKLIIGLSKIPRFVDMFARRLQIQERLTNQILQVLEEILNPKGIAVILTGEHSCASIRGVKKHGVNMKTRAFSGVFKINFNLRNELFTMINL